MDQNSRQELDRIIALGADGLTTAERDFLYARREYLTKAQRSEFKSVIEEKYQEVLDAENKKEE